MAAQTRDELRALYILAQSLQQAWADGKPVERQDAEALVSACRSSLEELPEIPGSIESILAYAAENREWDNEIVVSWPAELVPELAVYFSGNKMSQDKLTLESAAILQKLVGLIEDGGGILITEKGQPVPAADKDWVDLGRVVEEAHEWLISNGFKSRLTVDSLADFEA